jgi:small-conductance mechanosensitive channel
VDAGTPEGISAPPPQKPPSEQGTPEEAPAPPSQKPPSEQGTPEEAPVPPPQKPPSEQSIPEASAVLNLLRLPLFTISGTENLPAEERKTRVEERIQKVFSRYGPDFPPLSVRQVAGSTVVLAGEELLVTVLPVDLPEFNLHALSEGQKVILEREVAERWREALQAELIRLAVMHSPSYRRLAWGLAGILVLLAWSLHQVAGWMGRRWLRSPVWSLKFLLWSLTLVACLGLFPESQDLAWLLYSKILYPFLLLWGTLLATSAVSSLVEGLVHRYFLAYQQERQDLFLHRLSQRIATLEQAAQVTLRVVVFLAGILVYVTLLKIDLSAVLAGAGILGVALGLALQDFLKDVVAGVNILLEDQFGVGDVIEVDSLTGTVESFSLRSTRIRAVDGRMITMPNSSLRLVQNHSSGWARVDFKISVAYEDDLERALQALKEEAENLAEEWSDKILEPPVMMGVDALEESGVLLRVLLQTRPLSQWETAREMNRRVKLRFDKEGITIPYPQRVVRTVLERGTHEP